MNLNAIAAGFTRQISPPVRATLRVSTGSTRNADYSRTPTYQDFPIIGDVQALTGGQIEHMDALNLQGIMRTMYFNGTIEGLDRPAGKGGDLIVFTGPGVLAGTWLVVEVIEAWDTSGWVKVAIQLQNGS